MIRALPLRLLAAAYLAIAAAAFTGTGVLTGCTTTLAPGSERFVVEAEKELQTAFFVVDGFLEWEATNRTNVGREVTAAADALRIEFPGYLRSAQDVLRTYKRNRSLGNKATLETWLATLHGAMAEAVKHLPKATADKLISDSQGAQWKPN